MRASVYSVTTETGAYILRIHRGDDDSWKKVLMTQEIASQHGVAPAIIHIDHVERAAVSVRVSDISLGAALSRPETRGAALRSLLETLTKLHAIPAGPFAAINLIGDARSIWDEQVQRRGFPNWAIQLGGRIPEADELLQHDDRKVLSHCDLHPANILWDKRQVWLVDWERAGLAHPYLDLATICNFLSMPDQEALSMLEQQEQAPIEEAQKFLFAALRNLCRVVYGTVFFRLVSDLASIELPNREDTPTLRECFEMLLAGKLNLGEPQGRALVGAAFLKQCEIAT